MSPPKDVTSLQPADFGDNPVWEYLNDDALGETMMRPVDKLPADDLYNKIVGIRVTLANGSDVWASLGNINTRNPLATSHFLTLAVAKGGSWFHLARYHDIEYQKNGPAALAAFLGLRLNEIFPISYDVSRYAMGDSRSLAGEIPAKPRKKLSESEINKLAIAQAGDARNNQ